jgi:integrase
MYLDASNQLHDLSAGRMECPHCRSSAQLTPAGIPDFAALSAARPDVAGMVMLCNACRSPVFWRYRIKEISARRIDFYATPQEVEKPEERYSYNYLSDPVAASFREALGCYRNGLARAFTAMCRLTAQTVFEELGESGKLKIFDEIDEIARIADLDEALVQKVRNIIFGTSAESLELTAELDRSTAAVLLEIMKDLLHQTYVRPGRLKKILRMRRYFADPDDDSELQPDPKVTVLKAGRSAGTN